MSAYVWEEKLRQSQAACERLEKLCREQDQDLWEAHEPAQGEYWSQERWDAERYKWVRERESQITAALAGTEQSGDSSRWKTLAEKLRAALQLAVGWAAAAHDDWDADRESKVGKKLAALAGTLKRYAPDTDIIHAAIVEANKALAGTEQAESREPPTDWKSRAERAEAACERLELSLRKTRCDADCECETCTWIESEITAALAGTEQPKQPEQAEEAKHMSQFVTAKSFPLDAETGKFRSEPAEAAYIEAERLGYHLGRAIVRKIIQAYQCRMDECDREYQAEGVSDAETLKHN